MTENQLPPINIRIRRLQSEDCLITISPSQSVYILKETLFMVLLYFVNLIEIRIRYFITKTHISRKTYE